MIGTGSSCVIPNDIIIGGKLAFRAGERVTVEQIVPNAQMPDNKYVVLSAALQQRFQLRAEDLREVATQPPAFGPPVHSPTAGPKKTGAYASSVTKKNVLLVLGIGLGALILIIAVIAVINSSRDSGKQSTTTPAESVATPATPAAQKTWQTVITFDGNTSRRSQSFTLNGGEQRMTYSVVDSTGYGSVVCAVYVVSEGDSLETSGGLAEVTAAQPGPGDTMLVKEPGNYYLDVKGANCQWTVTIQELR